jgi:hypothetical protein
MSESPEPDQSEQAERVLAALHERGSRAWWAARWHIMHDPEQGLIAMPGHEARERMAAQLLDQATADTGLVFFSVTFASRREADIMIKAIQAYAEYARTH